MTIEEQYRANPMTWKDGLAIAGLVVTLGTVLVQGGRIVEKLDATNAKLTQMDLRMSGVQTEVQKLSQDVTQQRGVDRLHDEQITVLRRDVDSMTRRFRP